MKSILISVLGLIVLTGCVYAANMHIERKAGEKQMAVWDLLDETKGYKYKYQIFAKRSTLSKEELKLYPSLPDYRGYVLVSTVVAYGFDICQPDNDLEYIKDSFEYGFLEVKGDKLLICTRLGE